MIQVGKKKVRYIFDSGIEPKQVKKKKSIWMSSLKSPSHCECDVQGGLHRDNGFGGLKEH